MKKILIAALIPIFALLALPAEALTQRSPNPVTACVVHAPYGLPTVQGTVQPICREGYLSAYDPQAKIPRFVMWTLTPERAISCGNRPNEFVSDLSVRNGPSPRDYSGTGYDRGHMAPNGDQTWNPQVEYESFIMTNVAPQAGSLNRGVWRTLETSARAWASQQKHDFNIVSGSVYNSNDLRIGKGIVVPHAFYKIVVDQRTGMYAGWMFPHRPPYATMGNDLTKFRVPVAEIQRQAGVNYRLPLNGMELKPGQEWPADFGILARQTRATCRSR